LPTTGERGNMELLFNENGVSVWKIKVLERMVVMVAQ